MNNFITDYQKEMVVTDVETGTIMMTLPRYAAWAYDQNRCRNQVVECSNDLAMLKTKYQTDHVVVLHNRTIVAKGASDESAHV